MSSVKLCTKCQTVKPLIGGFYKAGPSWQKLCKICHNRKRTEYRLQATRYTPKLKGFNKLPLETQNKIKYDIHIKISYKKISTKYNIKYPTLLSWKRKGIAPYMVSS